jgi:hypothetical protein
MFVPVVLHDSVTNRLAQVMKRIPKAVATKAEGSRLKHFIRIPLFNSEKSGFHVTCITASTELIKLNRTRYRTRRRDKGAESRGDKFGHTLRGR